MRNFRQIVRSILSAWLTFVLFVAAGSVARAAGPADPLAWPAPTRENHPWTRWWWMGSAVDRTNLTRLLTMYHDAGLGGVEICPIYGAKGYESRYIEFLSPQWMEMLAHTTAEAKRLGMGVDLTTGTGWPNGGPRVSEDDASSGIILRGYNLEGGAKLTAALPQGPLQCLMAFPASGAPVDLTSRVKDGHLDWTAPAGKWKLYALVRKLAVQKVKRAAPGGVGDVLDPYSVPAMNRYLADFDRHFSVYHGAMPRSFFHDSFEYYGAQWTPSFFKEFEKRRGYDLRAQLPALFGDASADLESRVKDDYRETISDLHLAYIQRWTQWAHGHGSLTRNQAHGAPGNLVDIYAASDIPETEIFGSIDEKNLPMNKFSSSAAHVTGKKLASSESFTWLTEHFNASLSQVKDAADYLFLSGVNHIFFHGIPYSPEEAAWPGWQFYAAVNFGPQGGLWRDLPEFNAYVTRCQSILQAGRSSSDYLLYFPLDDIFQQPGDLVIPLTVHNAQTTLAPHPFYAAALKFGETGHAYDLVSDRVLASARAAKAGVSVGGNTYRAVIVPRTRVMPEATLKKLLALARQGAPVVFLESMPSDVPGLHNLEKRQTELKQTLAAVQFAPDSVPGIQRDAQVGSALKLATNLDALLAMDAGFREPCVDAGVRFVRRERDDSGGFDYFLANRADHRVDGWITMSHPVKSAVIMDPLVQNRTGVAATRGDAQGHSQIYLQLEPGESCIVRTFTSRAFDGPRWKYFESGSAPVAVAGSWKVQFVDGGPELPAGFDATELSSWTTLGGDEAKRFAGTARYTVEIDRPDAPADDWMLDLGKVCETARVKVNGRDAGALWCPPFRIPVGALLHAGKNTIEVEATNLAANRIADMDRRKVNWKYFYDANLASKRGGNLNAANWPLRDSGLIGPVVLEPVKTLVPAM